MDKEMGNGTLLVSIIVPVYNTEKYLNECINSLVHQKYTDIEIILINDGSTDHSLEVCKSWQTQDNRILVFDKLNEGPGIAREYGLQKSSGKYISFIDSDDWIDENFIAKLAAACEDNAADMSVCDICKFESDGRGEIKAERKLKMKTNFKKVYSAKEEPEIMFNFGASLCNKLLRKDYIKNLDICPVQNVIEDLCIASIHIARAKNIVYVPGCMYYYRQHEESATYNPLLYGKMFNSIETYYYNILKYMPAYQNSYIVKKIITDGISYYSYANRKDENVLSKVKVLKNLFVHTFSVQKDDIGMQNGIILGSYNLRCVIKEFQYFELPYFGFTSLISLMSQKHSSNYHFKHSNPFRSDALNKEYQNEFLNVLFDKEVIFIDLMEERYGVGKNFLGEYFTLSDAFYEAKFIESEAFEKIEFGSEEWFQLWKDACFRFIEIIKKTKIKKVILIKMRLATSYGEYGKEHVFKNREELERINSQIEKMEYMMTELLPSINIIAIPSADVYTDQSYAFGCYPFHLNDNAYADLAKIIRKNWNDTVYEGTI